MLSISNKKFLRLKLGVLTIVSLVSCLSLPSFCATADKLGSSAAQAESVMELSSRRVLYEKNAEAKLPMASTTKILTAVTVLENCALFDEFPIPLEAEGVEGSSVYLKAGDVYSVKDLLYGLMLRSGNDCATALALHTGGSIANFAQMMDRTAQKAGALSSQFCNPHGLPCEGHYTTAHDLNLIGCYAMHNTIFREIVGTKYYAPRKWANKNKMLTNYEGGIGIKTGYTKQAGRCLVSAAERNGMTLVCTVLNCPSMFERSAKLLDDAFSAYERLLILGADTPVPLRVGEKTLMGVTKEDLYYPLLPEEKALLRMETRVNEDKIGQTDEIIGQIKIYLINRLLFSQNLYKL
jgi:D-alanyl-D-alanine carboxypeptidase (penicillin-binding protein 5/6)